MSGVDLGIPLMSGVEQGSTDPTSSSCHFEFSYGLRHLVPDAMVPEATRDSRLDCRLFSERFLRVSGVELGTPLTSGVE